MPAVIADANIDDPPYDKKGNVIPFGGIRSVLLAICINDWKPSRKAKPLTESMKNRLLFFSVNRNDLKIINP